MVDDRLITTSSPHIHSGESVKNIMLNVVAALMLPLIGGIYFFGFRIISVAIVSVIAAVLTETVFQKLRTRPVTVMDYSAVVTGILLALNLPPGIPLWMAAVGAVVAISLGKQIYGGLGMNPFNPALIGRVFLMISFPVQMTTWINPGVCRTMPILKGVTGATPLPDSISCATPLQIMKMQGIATDYMKLFLGNIGGSIGETSAVLIIVGGLYLLFKGYIDWRVPATYLGTVAVLSLIFGGDPIFNLLSGGLMLGAFFMATDMVTSPVSRTGKIIFGIGAGFFTVLIRFFGGYPEGVSFSILLMNAFTPIINRYTVPRIYGEVKVR
ncbi:MAG: RnfABCDGE type electron transport complex subunit D [Tepidanaerobacteraceae bacterium]